MAQSLFQKVQTLISANLHSMVDKALDSNSVAVLDEYIRQAENNLDDLEDALVTVKGQVKTLQRKYEAFQAEAEALDSDHDLRRTPGKVARDLRPAGWALGGKAVWAAACSRGLKRCPLPPGHSTRSRQPRGTFRPKDSDEDDRQEGKPPGEGEPA